MKNDDGGRRGRDGFVEVREPHTGKLLFRYDPSRDIIEVQRRGVKTLIDLTQYREQMDRLTREADVLPLN